MIGFMLTKHVPDIGQTQERFDRYSDLAKRVRFLRNEHPRWVLEPEQVTVTRKRITIPDPEHD